MSSAVLADYSVASPSSLGRAGRGARVSYHLISTFGAVQDAALTVCAALVGCCGYAFVFDVNAADLNVITGIGFAESLVFLLVGGSIGLYTLPKLTSPGRHVAEIFGAWLFVTLSLTALFFLLKVGAAFSRGSMLSFACVDLLLLLSGRLALASFVHSCMARGAIKGRSAILIGEASELDHIAPAVLLDRFGYEEIARYSLPDEGRGAADQELVREVDLAIDRARECNVEEILLSLPWRGARLDMIRERLRVSPLPIRLLPDHAMCSVYGTAGQTPQASGLVLLQRAPLDLPERLAKRSMDIVLSSLAIVILSPIMLLCAAAICVETAGPPIFRQCRNGFNGRPFVIFKFRTMTVMEDGPTVIQASKGDRRVTKLGKLLRASSIDELPQLFNVLRGDMSIIGPRPHAVAHDQAYQTVIAKYAFRNHVRPGMTGWAQVNGRRGETRRIDDMAERVAYDLWYIDNWSLTLDLKILIMTCFEVARVDAY